MPFKLLVYNTDEPSPLPASFVFNQEQITIGRDPTNDLPLQDEKRVISKRHATITVDDARFHLTDLGSKNFTYLNGSRLASERPYEIRPGDKVRIGNFEITLQAVDAAPAPAPPLADAFDKTVFDASFVNPFEDEAKLLAATLRSIRKVYEEVVPNRREDALREALQASLGDAGAHEADNLVARLVGRPAAFPTAPPATPPPPPPSTPSPAPAPMPAAPSWPQAAVQPAPLPDAPRLHRLVDVVLKACARLIGTPWQFRHEFIGQTIMQAEDTAFLYEGNPEALKRHLLDPALSQQTFEERLALLEDAAEDLAVHQVALLDGYKASVQQGATHLLDQISPEVFEEQVSKERALYRFLPLLAKGKVLEGLQAQLSELRTEDWSAVERRSYRPAFVKAYLARMTSMRRPRSGSGELPRRDPFSTR